MERARVLARVVFPVPGKSSNSTWPPLARAASNLRVEAAWPRMILAMLAAIFSYTARAGEVLQQHVAATGQGRQQLASGSGLAAHDPGDVGGDFLVHRPRRLVVGRRLSRFAALNPGCRWSRSRGWTQGLH